MDDIKVKKCIAEIDLGAGKENARVLLTRYGGGTDEMMIVATKNGFIRFGLLIMKAAFADEYQEKKEIASRIDDLISPESDCCFDWIELRENIEEPQSEINSSAANYIAIFILFVVMLITVLGFANGIGVIIGWLS